MEEHDDKCKFILCLNRIQGIKEPALISRCAMFRFKIPDLVKTAEWIKKIAKAEKIIFENENLMVADITIHYGGDLRRILNDCLQILIGYKMPITKEDLHKIYDQAAKSVAERVYESKDPRKTFFEIYKTEAFDTRVFLEEYFFLMGEKGYKYAKEFAKIDNRLRGKASVVVQINYLFTMLESNWK